MYTQAVFKLRAPLSGGLSIYMGLSHDCNMILIGCFLIRILRGNKHNVCKPYAHAHLTIWLL